MSLDLDAIVAAGCRAHAREIRDFIERRAAQAAA